MSPFMKWQIYQVFFPVPYAAYSVPALFEAKWGTKFGWTSYWHSSAYTVKLQWLEHLWDCGNLFEIWVVRDTEG